MASSRKSDCMHCRHFFITWLGDFPRGCRAYGFRSPDLPSVVVQRESGVPCQLFSPRPQARKHPEKSEGRLVH